MEIPGTTKRVGKIFGAKRYWGHATCRMANAHPRMVLALILHEFGMTRPMVSIFHLPTHLSEKQEDIHKSLSRVVSFFFFFDPKMFRLISLQLSVVACQLTAIRSPRLTGQADISACLGTCCE